MQMSCKVIRLRTQSGVEILEWELLKDNKIRICLTQNKTVPSKCVSSNRLASCVGIPLVDLTP